MFDTRFKLTGCEVRVVGQVLSCGGNGTSCGTSFSRMFAVAISRGKLRVTMTLSVGMAPHVMFLSNCFRTLGVIRRSLGVGVATT